MRWLDASETIPKMEPFVLVSILTMLYITEGKYKS